MNPRNFFQKKSLIFSMALVIAVVLMLFFLIRLNVIQKGPDSPKIVEGVLDLSNWNSNNEKLLLLDGEWEFYWQGLIFPQDARMETAPIYASVPHLWSEGGDEHDEYATYRLRVRHAPTDVPLAVKIGTTSQAYRLYADEALIASNGEVDPDADLGSPQTSAPLTATFHDHGGDFDLIVQLRSNGDAFGGLWFPMQFGKERDVRMLDTIIMVKESVLLGALLMMALTYFSFYLVIRKDRLNLFIAAGCVLLMLRIAIMGERTLIRIFPELPMQVLTIIANAVDVWSPLPFLLLIHGLFPAESLKWPIRVYVCCAAAFSGLLFVVPIAVLIHISNVMYVIVLGAIVAGCMTVVKSLFRKRPGAFPHLIGFAAISILGIHDMLYSRSLALSRFGELVSVGATILLVAQAIVLAQRFVRSAAMVIEAEQAFLQAQIKPHFLYNTLNTIQTFCVTQPTQARDLIGDLATYLRSNFDFSKTEELVTVEAEMELVEAYLNIEQARFGNRLAIEYRIDERAERLLIPSFTIQPLAENAIRHGIMRRVDGGALLIEVKRENGFCRVRVQDDGEGISETRLAEVFAGQRADKERAGIGLRNIDARLRKRYGTGLRFETNHGSGATVSGTTVTFDIPIAEQRQRAEGSEAL